ncbi:MAG: 3-oxoacyl-[acyl-carrier-protein] synthase III C-terminal domain-containing protein [Bacteroidales bacterium]
MKSKKPIRIIASGQYLPAQVSSEELEVRFSLPRGWAELHSGVISRHHVSFETIGYMGARAIEEALEKANLGLGDIDLIISAGASFDYPLPCQSSIIKSELREGLHCHVPAIHVDTTCLSFVSAFEIAAKMLDGDQYKRIVIVSAEIASKGLNTHNLETLTLFGDGASAFILAFDDSSPSAFYKAYFKTYSEGVYHTIIRGGGAVHFFRDYPYDEKLHSFDMNGMKVLKLAARKLPDFMDFVCSDLSVSLADVDVIVPHQASKAGLSLFRKMFHLSQDQVKENIATHGNCIAASIPLLLHDTIMKDEIKRGDLCMLIGTSAGFSIGALLFRY